nr:hypothetical protein [Candidatus Sigynarchaeota archaeon]
MKFRTMLNVAWGTKVNNKEAFYFMRGFPGTFLLTERRAIIVAAFTEKQGLFKKKKLHQLCFEAGLHKVKEFKLDMIPQRRIMSAHITFYAHGQLAEDAMIQFLRINPDIWTAISAHLHDLKIKNPVADAGIVLVDTMDPRAWLNDRYDLQSDKGE